MIPLTARDNATRYGGKVRHLLKKLWEDFETEVVTQWRRYRRKYPEEENKLKAGDIVYIISKQTPIQPHKKSFPGQTQSILGRHKVGRILEVYPSLDGVGRRYLVKHGPMVGPKGQQVMQETEMSYMNIVRACDV